MKSVSIYWMMIGALVLASCSDFLDREPVTLASDVNFYKTPADASKALIGCYDGLQIIWSEGVSLPVAAEVFSDNAFGGTGNSDNFIYQSLDEFDKSYSQRDIFSANWSLYYKAIFRCNTLIAKFDQVEWGTQADLRKQYESEARFIRAYLYFDMVRLWGNIPLLTQPSAESVPQAAAADVYKVIAEDLKYAAENLASANYAAQPVASHGRITRWAARALAARVYLYYTGYYNQPDLVGVLAKTDAVAYLEDVIANSGHGLLDDFAKLWPAASVAAYAGEDNKETVFAIKYTYTSDYNGNTDGNHWLVMNGIREQFSYPYGNGWGGSTVNPKLWDAYDDADTRRAASIISIADEKIKFTNQSKQREYTGYYGKKYTPMVDENGKSTAEQNGGLNFQIGQFQDYVSIRYADVLLMAAELGSANAQTHFDAVRKRAYKTAFVPLTVSQAAILEERRLEFALEGIRYWDLLRQGVDVAAATIAENTTVLNGGTATNKSIKSANILTTKGLQQIPDTQITLSGNVLKQNDGWQ